MVNRTRNVFRLLTFIKHFHTLGETKRVTKLKQEQHNLLALSEAVG